MNAFLTKKLSLFYSRFSLVVFMSLCLIVFAKFWESGLGISSTTYGALSRDILDNFHWFKPRLADQIYDPFVDHPYLVLWINALIFKLTLVSAQTLRLTSSILGIIGLTLFSQTIKNKFSEGTAFLFLFFALTTNVFMNYFSSGWLDIPMVSFCLMSFSFVELSESKKNINFYAALGGLFLSFAFLSKGISALTIISLFIYSVFIFRKNSKALIAYILSSLIPLLAFTYFHYINTGFLFWSVYLKRQLVDQNDLSEQVKSAADSLWYVIALLKISHIYLLLGVAGLFLFFTNNKKYFYLILSILLVHIFMYSGSSRHYNQYVIPNVPWITLAAAYYINTKLNNKINVEKLKKVLLSFSMIYFVVLAVIPFQLHKMSGTEYKSFQKYLLNNQNIHQVLFVGDLSRQETWEGPASYIRWYYNKKVNLITEDQIANYVAHLSSDQVLLLENKLVQHLNISENLICLYNDTLSLLSSNSELCSGHQDKHISLSASQNLFEP